jgi:hypothetical protein
MSDAMFLFFMLTWQGSGMVIGYQIGLSRRDKLAYEALAAVTEMNMSLIRQRDDCQ